eukprot:CCRYP_003471-RE/>CCRYP_003471-RE protein AED:0.20 eAED:0.20 QI:197/1/1/1/0.75/0.6/5/2458/445
MWLFPFASRDPSHSDIPTKRNIAVVTDDEEAAIAASPHNGYSSANDKTAVVDSAESNGRVCQDNGMCAKQTDTIGDIATPASRMKRQRGIIYFRKIQANDRDAIQLLHEQLFPVDYKSDFFDGLCSERIMPGTSEPLYSCVACFKELSDEEFDFRRESQMQGCMKEGGVPFLFRRKSQSMLNSYIHCDEYGDCLLWDSDSLPDSASERQDNNDSESSARNNEQFSSTTCSHTRSCQPTNGILNQTSLAVTHEETEREKVMSFYRDLYSCDACNKHTRSRNSTSIDTRYLNEAGERIVGCLVGSFLSSSRLSSKHESRERDETAALLVPEPHRYSRMFYIMTLGTVPEFRRSGLGSILVNRVVDVINTRPECGALYLHVIVYNKGAMRLYERLSFLRVKEIQDYYTINNVNYNCFLYARYFHGNRGHRNSIYAIIIDFAVSLVNIF